MRRNPSNGNLINEIAWSEGGGGESPYEATPSYQTSLGYSARVVPDVSFDANPITGVWVWDSFTFLVDDTSNGWWIVGGTSVASPNLAGIVNRAGSFTASSKAELTKLYTDPAADFRDITYGACGFYQGYLAVAGWDPCTGKGTPLGYAGK